MFMGVMYVALMVIAGAIIAAVIVVLALRRLLSVKAADGVAAEKLSQREAELEALRVAKAESDRGLAVAEEKASRISGVEAALGEAREVVERLREEKAATERAFGATRQALSAKSEAALAEVRTGKGRAEEALAAKSEAVERLEAAGRELRNRLAAAEKAQAELVARCDTLKDEKAKVEEAMAVKSEAVERLEAAARELRDRLAATEGELRATRSEPPELRAELARLQETLSQERKQNEEKIALLNDAKGRLTEQFKVLAEEVMGRHGETFKQQNREQLDGLLTPLREQLALFQNRLQTDHIESGKDRERLVEQIRSLATTGATMTTETRNLTLALRGETHTQGAWGEMILSTILQRSGLREGEEYVTQESHATDEGVRLRPDVIVTLPDENRIVIDSKVSLSAFTDYVNDCDPVAKAAHLARHVASMRSHVKGLSRKEYHQVTGLDFVIMFVPIEGALAAALQGDPELTSFAAEHNVAIGTPTTLMLALRTVANVWRVERRNKNAEEIAERAGKLYDKFVGFAVDMRALGDQLGKARRAYDDALGKLSTGSGNLVRQTEMLKALGAKTAKTLPLQLADSQTGDGDESLAPAVVNVQITEET
jgi:DNA recombination protein RmuC